MFPGCIALATYDPEFIGDGALLLSDGLMVLSILAELIVFLLWFILVTVTLCRAYSVIQGVLWRVTSAEMPEAAKELRSGRRGALLQMAGLVISSVTALSFVALALLGPSLHVRSMGSGVLAEDGGSPDLDMLVIVVSRNPSSTLCSFFFMIFGASY